MINLKINVDDKATPAVRRVRGGLSGTSLAAFMSGRVNEILQERAEWRFQTEGTETKDWLPLKSSTQSFREADGWPPAHPINRRTGGLGDWLTSSRGTVAGTAYRASIRWPGEAPDAETAKKFYTAQRGRNKPFTLARPVVEMDVTTLKLLASGLDSWINEHATQKWVTV